MNKIERDVRKGFFFSLQNIKNLSELKKYEKFKLLSIAPMTDVANESDLWTELDLAFI